jgi:integrase
MATLEKRGRTFRIVFRFQGEKYARSLATRSEKAASGALARLEDNLHRVEIGTLEIPVQGDLVSFLLGEPARKEKTGAPQLPPAPEKSALTLSGLFKVFWEKLPEGSLEDSTITGMEIHERQLEKYFLKDFLIQGLTLTDLQGYVERRSRDKGLHGRKVTATTIKKAIVTLRTVWNWGRQHGLLDKAFPSKGIKYPKGTEKPPFMTLHEVERRVKGMSAADAATLWECAFLSSDEIAELLREVKRQALQPSVYAMFVFATHTGARRAEMIRSNLSDLDFENNLVTIHERKRSHESRTTRRVPMSPLLREVLKELLADHPDIEATFWHELPAMRGHHRIPPQRLDADTAHYHFKHTLKNTKWERLRGWHALRHSFCSNAAAVGIDQRVINDWVAENVLSSVTPSGPGTNLGSVIASLKRSAMPRRVNPLC